MNVKKYCKNWVLQSLYMVILRELTLMLGTSGNRVFTIQLLQTWVEWDASSVYEIKLNTKHLTGHRWCHVSWQASGRWLQSTICMGTSLPLTLKERSKAAAGWPVSTGSLISSAGLDLQAPTLPWVRLHHLSSSASLHCGALFFIPRLISRNCKLFMGLEKSNCGLSKSRNRGIESMWRCWLEAEPSPHNHFQVHQSEESFVSSASCSLKSIK